VAGSCDRNNKPMGLLTGRNFLEKISNSQHLKACVPRNWLKAQNRAQRRVLVIIIMKLWVPRKAEILLENCTILSFSKQTMFLTYLLNTFLLYLYGVEVIFLF
jgi:hypothetical protein